MKSKKTAFMAVFMYCLITSGIWGMLIAYTKSYNKLSAEKSSEPKYRYKIRRSSS